MGIDEDDRNGVDKANGRRLLGLASVITATCFLQGCGQGNDSAPLKSTPIAEKSAKPADAASTNLERNEKVAGKSNGFDIKMVLIPAGEFLMGSPDSDDDARDTEKPEHRVRIARPFHLGVHEVTQGQWAKVMGTTPWKGQRFVKEGDRYPATHVSWEDATEFCRKLTMKERAAGRLQAGESYRLPTEAEWEYACRAGSRTRYHFGDGEGSLGEYAWHDKNASKIDENYAHAVGLMRGNAWGLFDMQGNVMEWCSDWYGKEYYGESPGTDPRGPSRGSFRVFRGGSWFIVASGCRSAFRSRLVPVNRRFDLGFRLARSSAPSQ